MPNIIITGGNDGIGWHMTRQFLEDGHRAAVLDVRTDRLEELAQQYPDTLLVCVGDVSDGEAVKRCVSEVQERWGSVDIAVHNACVCVFASFEETSDADMRRVHDVNFGGAVNLARCVLPLMKVHKSGRLCFVSSGVGVMGFEGLTAYASSKGAIEALARCLDIEYTGTGVSVRLLHPPLTRTVSSSPLPVPPQMMADPEKVGRGLARRIGKKGFIICHSAGQQFQTRLAYLFSLKLGRLMSRMTRSAEEAKQSEM